MKMKINRKHFKTGLLKVYRWPAVSVASFTRKADSLCQPQTTASESLRLGVLPVIPMSSGLKLNIQKTKIMASGAITSWQIDGETVKDFILGGSKITADGDCSHEIKRHLLLQRKVITNLDSILKSRDITLPTKVCIVTAMVFPIVTYGCESWMIKQPEHRRIDACGLEKTLESPLDCKKIKPVHSKGNQS